MTTKKRPSLYLIKANNNFLRLTEEALSGLDHKQLVEIITSSKKEILHQMMLSIKTPDKKIDKVIKDLEKGLNKLNLIYPGIVAGISKTYDRIPQA